MKIITTLCILILMATSCFAQNSCPDVKDAASTAMDERNGRTAAAHDATMPDPEEDRSDVSTWLGNIASIGDAFTLGVSIPSLDSLLGDMCGQMSAMLEDKINEVHTQVRESLNEIGENSPFKVYGTGSDYIVTLTGKLQ